MPSLHPMKGPANESFSFGQVFIVATRDCYYDAVSRVKWLQYSEVFVTPEGAKVSSTGTGCDLHEGYEPATRYCWEMLNVVHILLIRNHHIGTHKLADIKVSNDYDFLMDHCCSIFNDILFGCWRAGTGKMVLPSSYPF